MPSPFSFSIILSLLLIPSVASGQNFVDLDFSQNIQPTNAVNPNNSTLGPDYFAGLTLDFANVAFIDGLPVDARVAIDFTAAQPVSPGYEFVGYIPDYDAASGGPEGDLGVYYKSIFGNTSAVTGGISMRISFFEGGGNFTTATTLTHLRFLIYDHDGEPGQSESVRTYLSDGFSGYQIGDDSGIHSHDEGNSWRFDAFGQGFPETSPDGGFIAYYQNTSSIRFDLFSTTEAYHPAVNSGIFVAFDGDLGLLDGDSTGFGTFIPIPEPSTPLIALATTAMGMLRRSRTTG